MNIDTDKREDHFLEFDLIDRAQTFVKMRWRINMSTPLTDVGENFREKTVAYLAWLFFVPVNCLLFLIRKTGPVWNSRTKLVR